MNTFFRSCLHFSHIIKFSSHHFFLGPLQFCQTLGLVLRHRVDFVLPLSQEQQEEQAQEEQKEQPLTKIYQKGVY